MLPKTSKNFFFIWACTKNYEFIAAHLQNGSILLMGSPGEVSTIQWVLNVATSSLTFLFDALRDTKNDWLWVHQVKNRLENLSSNNFFAIVSSTAKFR